MRQSQIRINPLVEMLGDFSLTILNHRINPFCKTGDILIIKTVSNALKQPEIDFYIHYGRLI